MAASGVSAQGAAAATLYTSAAHTTEVAVGATAYGLTNNLLYTSGTAVLNSCTTSTLHLVVSQNSGGNVVFTAGGWIDHGCTFPTSMGAQLWRIVVSGASTVVGLFSRWGASISNWTRNFLGGSYTGNLTTGVSANQPTAAGAPISFSLSSAGSFAGPLTGAGKLDGVYALAGTAANWSLTN